MALWLLAIPEVRDAIGLGPNPSSEARGVNCIECGCGLPPNNWKFVHTGDGGWVYVFYADREDDVTVVDTIGFSANGEGASVNGSNARTVKRVKVIEYIRNKTKEKGYTCLNCLAGCCRAGHPGWDRVLNEVNGLLRSNGIKVEVAQFDPTNGNRY